MKISAILSSLVLIVSVMMLSGCLFPCWDDAGGGQRRGGHRGGGQDGGGYEGGGHHEGGERR
jgi:hypothetical protein